VLFIVFYSIFSIDIEKSEKRSEKRDKRKFLLKNIGIITIKEKKDEMKIVEKNIRNVHKHEKC
jgi:hypothetical protein